MCWFESSPGHHTSFLGGIFYDKKKVVSAIFQSCCSSCCFLSIAIDYFDSFKFNIFFRDYVIWYYMHGMINISKGQIVITGRFS